MNLLGDYGWPDHVHHRKTHMKELTKPGYASWVGFHAPKQNYAKCPLMALGGDLQLGVEEKLCLSSRNYLLHHISETKF
jgi:hypothetical protein